MEEPIETSSLDATAPSVPDPDLEVGDALIVIGYRAYPEAAGVQSRTTQLAAALLGARRSWRIRRLAAPGPERDVPMRRNVRREIDALGACRGALRLVVLTGELTRTLEGLSLVCAPDLAGFREDATVPLSWIGERLHRSAPTITVLVAHAEPRDPQRWLAAFAAPPGDHLVVASGEEPATVLDAMLDALVHAVDSEFGRVTMRALGAALEVALPGTAIAASRSTLPILELASTASGAPDFARDDEDLVGTVLPGRYRVDAEIARGGFAIVYRAQQELVGRDVAVKVLRSNLGRDSAQLFVEEIRAVARLDHVNIVRVFHADLTRGGRLFLAMEHLAGQTLEQLLETGPLPAARAMATARQLLAGLATAHASGIVHADVKPANIMITGGADERVVLLDFGFARLRAEAAVRSAGGTPEFMAPEQLRDGLVTVRSDLFATGLVLLTMLAGALPRPTAPARDRVANRVVDPALDRAVDRVVDAGLRAVLRRALAEDPDARFASAAEMLAALPAEVGASFPAPPFRPAAPFSEAEHASFFGRDREIDAALGHVLFRRAIVYVAPSGTGKTSLLRAGLSSRLARLGVRTVYIACRATARARVAEAIDPAASSVGDAIARYHRTTRRRLVLIIDQVEAELQAAAQMTVVEQLELDRWPHDTQVSVILAVREDYLARLLDRTQRIDPGIPIVRLAPLTPAQARDVLHQTLAARKLTIEAVLMDTLVADLARAASKLQIETSGSGTAIYAPHLQLVGALLHDALPAGATEIPLALYRQLGGLDAIVAEHLHRVLEGELPGGHTAIARDLLLAIVTASPTRAGRGEAELIAMAQAPGRADAGHAHERSAAAIRDVLGFLRDRGLLVAAPDAAGEPAWELAHDSLIERVQQWITATDLARRRTLELVRHHLRRSRGGVLSLLGAGELRELRAHVPPTDLDALDAEWARPDQPYPATTLVASSRRAIRRRRWLTALATTTAMATIIVFTAQWLGERALRKREEIDRDRDLGRFVLELRAFDRDPETLAVLPTVEALELTWRLHRPDRDDEDSPGELFPAGDLERRPLAFGPSTRTEEVRARGGPAVLVVTRNDRTRTAAACNDIMIPIRRLPGYSDFKSMPRFVMNIPSCAVSAADMIEIPAGPFIAGGQGEPPTPYRDEELPREAVVDLPAYRIDRTEVSNATLAPFLTMTPLHGMVPPSRLANTERYSDRAQIAANAVTWREARAFCRYLGKDLPTIDEWDKALRGGIIVADELNPCPRRNFAWCGPMNSAWTNIRIGDAAAQQPVGSNTHDASPYGVLDMVGSMSEWTRSPDLPYETLPATLSAAQRRRYQTQSKPIVIVRGCNWGDVECATAPLSIMPIPNPRLRDVRYFTLGFRCAAAAPPRPAALR